MLSFLMMGIDKKKAIHHQYRIPEKMLFLVALLGGAVGGTIGMQIFHHKTRHWYFKYGFPIVGVIQIIFFCYIRMEVL